MLNKILDIYETLRIKLRNICVSKLAKLRRNKIKNYDFTIISNNCWGGTVYQSYGLEYKTPTIGLFFMADDYVKFVYGLEHYLNSKLSFIDPKESKYYSHFKKWKKFGDYPIGVLDDIEIHFLHYHSKKEACEKWLRRAKRVNYNKIIFKFNDQNLCSEQLLEKFSQLPAKNKVCFTTRKYKINNTIHVKSLFHYSEIRASYEPFGNTKLLNINEFINNL